MIAVELPIKLKEQLKLLTQGKFVSSGHKGQRTKLLTNVQVHLCRCACKCLLTQMSMYIYTFVIHHIWICF